MSQQRPTTAVGNPLSTRYVRPGAIPYIFPPGESPQQLLQLLERNGWWGQIIGPHGSGKSALLATLIPLVEQAGRKTLLVELHDGQRRLPVELSAAPRPETGSLIVIDGYEQLSRLSRFRVRRFCRRQEVGLLVTAHRPVGLPPLYRSNVDIDTAERVVKWLLGEAEPLVTRDQLADCLQNHGGDMRESLFALYDLHERKKQRKR